MASTGDPLDLVGKTVGAYRIVELLGAGGMGAVYKALHPELEVHRALKVIHPRAADVADITQRFRREARNAATLRHPNIVQVHDFGVAGELHYMVLELIEGPDLRSWLATQGPLRPLARILEILEPLAAALDHAHRQGVVHRDLKPANVMLDRDGRVVLTDFGISKMLLGDTALTQTGAPLGSPHSMSPEQASGAREIGPATDVFALGVLAYQALTGRMPFEGTSALVVLSQILHQPTPPPRDICPDIPESVQAVLLRATAKSPADRYASAGEMVAAMREALEPEGQTRALSTSRTRALPLPSATLGSATNEHPAKRKAPWLAVAAGLAGLVAIALIGLVVAPRLRARGTDPAGPAATAEAATADSVAATETVAGAAALDAPPVVKVRRPAVGTDPATVAGGSVAQPFEIEPGMSYEVRLGKDEEVYFVVDEPTSDLGVVLDMRALEQIWIAHSFLHRVDSDGEVLQPALVAEVTPTYIPRVVASYSSPRPERHLLRLRNEFAPAEYWLTFFEGRPDRLLPFYGGELPESLALGTDGYRSPGRGRRAVLRARPAGRRIRRHVRRRGAQPGFRGARGANRATRLPRRVAEDAAPIQRGRYQLQRDGAAPRDPTWDRDPAPQERGRQRLVLAARSGGERLTRSRRLLILPLNLRGGAAHFCVLEPPVLFAIHLHESATAPEEPKLHLMNLPRSAAVAYALASGVVIGFQLALAFGAPWGAYAMGGAFPGRFPPGMRLGALVQAGLMALMACVILSRARLALPRWYRISRRLVWAIVAMGGIGLTLNLVTPSSGERAIWAPVALLLLACSLVVATAREGSR